MSQYCLLSIESRTKDIYKMRKLRIMFWHMLDCEDSLPCIKMGVRTREYKLGMNIYEYTVNNHI